MSPGRVEAVSRLGVQGWREQADRIVMVQRADGQARSSCQVRHLQSVDRMQSLLSAAMGKAAMLAIYGLNVT